MTSEQEDRERREEAVVLLPKDKIEGIMPKDKIEGIVPVDPIERIARQAEAARYQS